MSARCAALVLIGAVCAVTAPAFAAFERAPLDAPSAALGGVTATSQDPVFGNAGALPTQPLSQDAWRLQCDASRPFGSAALGETQASASVHRGRWGWGLGARRFGTEDYSENELRVVLASHREPASVGLAVRGLEVSGTGFFAVRSVAVDAALFVRPAREVEVGAVVEGVAGDIPGDALGSARRVALGISGPIGPVVRVFLEGQRRGMDPLGAAVGVAVQPVRSLTLRAGVRTDPEGLAWGLSFALPAGTLNVAAQVHDPLGTTLRVGLQTGAGSRRNERRKSP